jgi:hypothetical protein
MYRNIDLRMKKLLIETPTPIPKKDYKNSIPERGGGGGHAFHT